MMRYFYLYILSFFVFAGYSQNSARLICSDGSRFKVYVNDRLINKEPQASILLEKLLKDTLYIKVEFENSARYGVSIYMLDKGMPVSNKEFNYRLTPGKTKVSVDFLAIYDIVPLPDPLVPKNNTVERQDVSKTLIPEHFCELKNGTPVYFNNLPKEGSCKTAMPAAFLDYGKLLINKAPGQDEKYSIAETICRNNCLSVEQLNVFLSYLDFELDKLKLTKLAYYNLVDIEHQKDLEKSFKISASKNELTTFLEHAGDYKIKSGSTCIQPSPEEDIRKLGDNLTAFMGDAQRLDVLKKIYSNYCYSVDQAIFVLQKFTHDREKLEASKLLYFNCTEKSNFIKVTEVFSFKEYANGLKDFMEKQAR